MQTEKVLRSQEVCQKKHGFYHSSVLQAQAQGSSYFITNDGNVPTSPYKMPANTQTLSWNGNAEKSFRLPMAHVAAMKYRLEHSEKDISSQISL